MIVLNFKYYILGCKICTYAQVETIMHDENYFFSADNFLKNLKMSKTVTLLEGFQNTTTTTTSGQQYGHEKLLT